MMLSSYLTNAFSISGIQNSHGCWLFRPKISWFSPLGSFTVGNRSSTDTLFHLPKFQKRNRNLPATTKTFPVDVKPHIWPQAVLKTHFYRTAEPASVFRVADRFKCSVWRRKSSLPIWHKINSLTVQIWFYNCTNPFGISGMIAR